MVISSIRGHISRAIRLNRQIRSFAVQITTVFVNFYFFIFCINYTLGTVSIIRYLRVRVREGLGFSFVYSSTIALEKLSLTRLIFNMVLNARRLRKLADWADEQPATVFSENDHPG